MAVLPPPKTCIFEPSIFAETKPGIIVDQAPPKYLQKRKKTKPSGEEREGRSNMTPVGGRGEQGGYNPPRRRVPSRQIIAIPTES